MNTAETRFSFSRFLWIALIITAVRILYLFLNQRNLDVEEAQYWSWSQHLALGYHSKPPMISWVIFFSTALFGSSEWAIRLFSPIAYLCSALFLYGCGKNLYHREAIGYWSGISVLLLPGVTYSATIGSTDPLLILFWSMALYGFIRAQEFPKGTPLIAMGDRKGENRDYPPSFRAIGKASAQDINQEAIPRESLIRACQTKKIIAWIICGIAIGLGLLSKYTMLAFLLSAALYFICSQTRPTPLKTLGPYLAIILAALIFLPNVIWNTQHHNAALHHVVEHNIDVGDAHFYPLNLGLFIVNQMAILGPILLVCLAIALLRLRQMPEREPTYLLVCFTVPMLLLIAIEALLSRAYANWAAVAYPSGIILTVAYLWENNFRGWLKSSVILNIVIGVALYGWELALAYGYSQWPQPDHPNWRDFGAAIQRQQAAYPTTHYLVADRELWSKTLYYGKVSQNHLYVWDPQHRADWLDNPARSIVPLNKQFIFMTYDTKLPAKLSHAFKHHTVLGVFTVSQRLRGRQDRITVYVLH